MKKLFNSIRSKVNDMTTRAMIAVVIGALLLSLLYGLFNTTIMPTVTKKITDLFNFKG